MEIFIDHRKWLLCYSTSQKNILQTGSQKVKDWRLFYYAKPTELNKLKIFGYVKLLEFSLHKKFITQKCITDFRKNVLFFGHVTRRNPKNPLLLKKRFGETGPMRLNDRF